MLGCPRAGPGTRGCGDFDDGDWEDDVHVRRADHHKATWARRIRCLRGLRRDNGVRLGRCGFGGTLTAGAAIVAVVALATLPVFVVVAALAALAAVGKGQNRV